jgi:hypothetical protein
MIQEQIIKSSGMLKSLEIDNETVAPFVSSHRSQQKPNSLGQCRNGNGRFVYAVVLSNGNHDKGEIDLLGLDGCKVYTIHYRDIAAVVSDYPIKAVSLIRKNLSPYHDVTRRFAEICTTIPARFGQIANDGEEVLGLLRYHYSRIKKELERLDQMVEMGVKLFWEVDNLFEYFVKTDAELRMLRDQIFSRKSPPTTLELIQLGEFFSNKMNVRKAAVSQNVVSALRGVVAEEKLDRSNEEKIVVNGWFLVRKERLGDFEESVNKAASLVGEDYAVKVNGPWVPFNFVKHIELEM